MKKWTVIALLLAWCYTVAAGQESFYHKLDGDVGLPSDEVYEVLQDTFGYVWVGCDAGLFRYDGVHFVQYLHPKQSGRSISSLRLDRKNRVWCVNFSGQLFYVRGDSLVLFKDFSQEASFYPHYTINTADDELWVANDLDCYVYDLKKMRLKFRVPNPHLFNSPFNVVEADARGNVYLTNVENLYAFDRKNKKFVILKHLKQTQGEEYRQLRNVNGRVFALGQIVKPLKSSKYSLYELKGERINYLNTFSLPVPNMLQSSPQLSICTNNGIFTLDKNFNLLPKVILPNEKISDLMRDREGNIWLTSLQNGIYIIPSPELKIYKEPFLPEANVSALSVRNGELVIGTFSGNIFFLDSNETQLRTFRKTGIVNYNMVRDFKTYKDKWIVARGALVVIDGNKETKISNNIREMAIIGDSLFAISTAATFIYALNPPYAGRIVIAQSGKAVRKHPTQDKIFYALKDGLFIYEKGKSKPLLFQKQPLYVTTLEWQGGTLWVGTVSQGLLAYRNGRFLETSGIKKHLRGKTIRKIKHHKGKLLVATEAGLNIWDLKRHTFRLLDASDGLRQREINAIEVFRNRIYIATTRGLLSFPLEMRTENETAPNVRIKHFFANDLAQPTAKFNQLPHNQNDITINFETAMFRSRGTYYYEYRLNGLDTVWHRTEALTPSAAYKSLPWRSFIFEVRAVNEDGIFSTSAVLPFEVRSPIWWRWWFVLLSAALLISAVYWRVTVRIRNIKQQANLQQELQNSQLTALKAQMNPHFLYNALNSIQDLILQKDVLNANRYLTKFSQLMRNVLDASSSLSISLKDEIRILTLYLELEKLRFGDDFHYQIDIPPNLATEQIFIPSMIIQPFVENAIKHGLLHKTNGEKWVKIDFQAAALLYCTITDNGVGRARAEAIKKRRGKLQPSFATSATQRRLEILNQKYQQTIGVQIIDSYDTDEKPNGTKVILTLPLG